MRDEVREELRQAIIDAAQPALRSPIYHSVHRAVYLRMHARLRAGDMKVGEIDDVLRDLVQAGFLVYATGRVIPLVRPVPPEHAACRLRTDAEELAVRAAAGRVGCAA